MVDVGDMAPDFALPDRNGAVVRLSEFRGKKPVVLFFYPKDNTLICTKESCLFRDRYADITATGAELLGVSADDEASHASFAERYALPYRLLSDRGGATAKAYGVGFLFGLGRGRSTFVIDENGRICQRTDALFAAEIHVSAALEALLKLSRN